MTTLIYVAVVFLAFSAFTFAADEAIVEQRPSLECNRHDSSPYSCQNFARFCINMINDQIRKNLNATYTYVAMSKYFQRTDIAYRGFSKYFSHLADEQKEQSKKLTDYLLKRGGRLRLKHIHDPKLEWSSPLEALQDSIRLERDVNDALLNIHWVASEKNDPHLQHFLEGELLGEEVEVLHQLSQYITVVDRLSAVTGLGWHVFDQHLYDGKR